MSPRRAGHPPVVAAIAGSDPSGGAGMQADLKTMSALGAYGCAVITALTAQSTRGVTGVHAVPADFVRHQVETLVEDVALDAVKVGMLATADIIGVVAELTATTLTCPVVLDPVMVATSGDRLLDETAVDALRTLIPLVDAVTPNIPEAAALLGSPPATSLDAMRDQATALHAAGARRVLLKGGHSTPEQDRTGAGEVVDVWVDEGGLYEVRGRRVTTSNSHGTGDTLSSALASLLPQRTSWLDAVIEAKAWLTDALAGADALDIGAGPGPVHHFHALWPAIEVGS